MPPQRTLFLQIQLKKMSTKVQKVMVQPIVRSPFLITPSSIYRSHLFFFTCCRVSSSGCSKTYWIFIRIFQFCRPDFERPLRHFFFLFLLLDWIAPPPLQKTRTQIWLYEQTDLRIEGFIAVRISFRFFFSFFFFFFFSFLFLFLFFSLFFLSRGHLILLGVFSFLFFFFSFLGL